MYLTELIERLRLVGVNSLGFQMFRFGMECMLVISDPKFECVWSPDC